MRLQCNSLSSLCLYLEIGPWSLLNPEKLMRFVSFSIDVNSCPMSSLWLDLLVPGSVTLVQKYHGGGLISLSHIN